MAVAGPAADVDARPQRDLRGVAGRVLPDPAGTDREPDAPSCAGADHHVVGARARAVRTAAVEFGADVARHTDVDVTVSLGFPELDHLAHPVLQPAVLRLGERDTRPGAEHLD